ncbi:MAG: hypothetical protein V1787_01220, partial [Candidatus Micrarchaeota archaeon]
EIGIATGVLTAAVLLYSHSVKKASQLSGKKIAIVERRLDDLNVYVRHVGEDLSSLRNGIGRKIDSPAARERLAATAAELAVLEKDQRIRA